MWFSACRAVVVTCTAVGHVQKEPCLRVQAVQPGHGPEAGRQQQQQRCSRSPPRPADRSLKPVQCSRPLLTPPNTCLCSSSACALLRLDSNWQAMYQAREGAYQHTQGSGC